MTVDPGQPQEAQYSYLYDGKGNVSAVLDGTQNVVAAYRYDEFGNLVSETSTVEQPYKFSTKRYYAGLGLNYYGYRFYSPSLGRWMTRDPLGEVGGLNLYGAMGNNAVNLFDPYGLDWILYTGQYIYLYGGNIGDKSTLIKSCKATSGLPGYQVPKYQNKKDRGPIPAGDYRLDLVPDPTRTANANPDSGDELLRNPKGGIEQIPQSFTDRNGITWSYPGWGSWRGLLEPVNIPNGYGRGSFYLHDSDKGYTHGCIETCSYLLDLLLKYRIMGNNYIDVSVDYTDPSTYGGTEW